MVECIFYDDINSQLEKISNSSPAEMISVLHLQFTSVFPKLSNNFHQCTLDKSSRYPTVSTRSMKIPEI